MQTKDFKSLYKVITINLLIIFIFIFLIELIFGNWIFNSNINSLNLIKNKTFVYSQDLYPGNEKIVYIKDQFGFRGQYKSLETINILTIGGSTTDQRYITEGKTWQDIIAKNFKSNGKEVSVVNAGIDGQSTFGHIKNFELWFSQIENLKPDYLLFYIGINDLITKNRVNDNMKYNNSLYSSLKNKSIFAHMLRTLKGILLAKQSKVGHSKVDFNSFQWIKHGLLSEEEFQELKMIKRTDYQKRLEKLIEVSKGSFKKNIIFVTQKFYDYKKSETGEMVGLANKSTLNGYQVNAIDKAKLIRALNEVSMSFCQSINAICLDLANEIEFNDMDYYDFAHNTPSGAKKIGDFIYRRIKNIYN